MDDAFFQPLINRTLSQLDEVQPEMGGSDAYSETRRYTDPKRYVQEHQAIFQRLPNYVGRISELPEPGDFVKR